MKLVFLSCYFNHHQRPLSDALAARCDYSFISTTPYNPKRLALGWQQTQEPDYVCHYDREPERAEALLKEADVIVTGSAPEALVRQCLRRGQLVLRYAERPLKDGLQWGKYLPRLAKWHYQNLPWYRVCMLCASAYTASDYARFGLFRGKAFRWGYFPEFKEYDSIPKLLEQKKPASILWAGRYLDWKHPDDALTVAQRLKEAGYDFTLDMLGTGPMEQQLQSLVREKGLQDRVRLLGSMPPEQVRSHMERSELFLFTSDRREGWGAVLNEAMNSGCCVAANVQAGSAPCLICDGENGVLYRTVDDLYDKLSLLLENAAQRRQLGHKAYETIAQAWNPETAARRLLELSAALLDGKKQSPFQTGPCSASK